MGSGAGADDSMTERNRIAPKSLLTQSTEMDLMVMSAGDDFLYARGGQSTNNETAGPMIRPRGGVLDR